MATKRLRSILPTIVPIRLGALSVSLDIGFDLFRAALANKESEEGEEKKDDTG